MIPTARPTLVAHCDWSVDPGKRWCATAVWRRGRYRALAPAQVAPLDRFWPLLTAAIGRGSALLGFDFPLGVPAGYAARAGIDDFVPALRAFGTGRWSSFYQVATHPDEIDLARPFYPHRAGARGQASQRQLAAGLGLPDTAALWRRSDRATGTRRRACPLFWTMGASQVGKAAITGWRDLLAPALADDLDVAIWPFDGDLTLLLERHRFVVAETYPGEIYHHLNLPLVRPRGGSKRRQADRRANATALRQWLAATGTAAAAELVSEITDGFGATPTGEDRFDSVVGLFGLLNVILGRRPSGEPEDSRSRRVEGWIFGQTSRRD